MSNILYKQGSNGQFYPVNQGNNRNYNNAPQQQQQQQQYKKSGATYSRIKNGNFEGDTIVNAWRATKAGLMKAVVAPYAGQDGKGRDIVTSNGKSGNQDIEYQKMICTITNTNAGTTQTYHVLMNLKTKVISIKELGLCITPNGSGVTRKGKRVTGYFGRNYKS